MGRALDIILGVKNDMAAGLAAGQRDLRGFAGQLGSGGSPLDVGNIIKLAAAVNVARSAFVGVASIISAIDGDWSRVDESLKRLPLGLGALYQAGRDLVDVATGYTENLERQEAYAKKLAQWAKEEAENKKIASELTARGAEAFFEASQSRRGTFDQQREAAAREMNKARNDILAQEAAETTKIMGQAGWAEPLEKLKAAVDIALKGIVEKYKARYAEIGEAQMAADAERVNQANETAKKIAEAADREAEAVNDAYMRRVNEAAERQKQFRSLAESLIPATTSAVSGSGTIDPIEAGARFAGHAAAARADSAREQQASNARAERDRKDMVRVLERSLTIQDQMLRMLNGIGIGRI